MIVRDNRSPKGRDEGPVRRLEPSLLRPLGAGEGGGMSWREGQEAKATRMLGPRK